jgi:hypothetical protein
VTGIKKGHSMRTSIEELTMNGALSDPLIRTLMAADNVDPVRLESMLRRIAQQVAPALLPTPKAGSATHCG